MSFKLRLRIRYFRCYFYQNKKIFGDKQNIYYLNAKDFFVYNGLILGTLDLFLSTPLTNMPLFDPLKFTFLINSFIQKDQVHSNIELNVIHLTIML